VHESSEDDAVQRQLNEILSAEPCEWQASLERACGEHPELAAELRRRFEVLQRAGMVEAPDERAFGGFELLRVLGQGGMGVVHLARQRSTGRLVALKLVRPELIGLDKARRRFQREIEAVSRLDHPGICTVYEAGEVDGTPYVAMRFVEGSTVAELIRQGVEQQAGGTESTSGFDTSNRRGVEAVVQLFEQIATALHAAHEQGVLHRDVKPGNIMIDAQGRPVVLDFGLATADEPGTEALTLSADQIGTPAYMSPEQVQGKVRALDPRSDVYALGVTLYEFVAGVHPFESPTRDVLYRRILDGRPASLSSARPGLPRDLAVVVQTAMAREPDHRYESAAAFAADLRRVRLREPIVARRPSLARRLVRWCQREPMVAVLVAALLLTSFVSVWLAIDANRSRDAAELAEQVQLREAEHARQQAATSARVTEFLVGLFQVADGSTFRGQTVTAREVLDQGFRRIDQELVEEPEIRARLMLTMGQVYQHLGAFERAGQLFDRALELRRSTGASAVEHAECLRLVGELLHLQQRYLPADAKYREALQLLESAGEGHERDVARTVDLLGRALRDQGQRGEAARLHERAFALRKQLVDEPLELAESHQSLAMLANWNADTETAIREFQAAIAIRERELGPQSGRMPALLHGLGMTYFEAGDADKGTATIEQALALTRSVFGDDHHGVGYCLSMLGTIAADAGDRATAERHYREAQRVFAAFYGARSREVATQIHNLGSLHRDVGDFAKALERFEQALEIRAEVLVDNDPDFGRSYVSIAGALQGLQRFDEARQQYQRAVDAYSASLGDPHPETQATLRHYVQLLERMDPDAAKAMRARLRER